MNIFIRNSCDPRKKENEPHGGHGPQVENHCVRCSTQELSFGTKKEKN